MRRPYRRPWAVVALVFLGGACALPKDPVPVPPAAAADAARGGVLSVAITAPAGVDPLSFHEPSGMLVGGLLCDTLVTIDPDSGLVQPGLAQKWTLTDEGRRIIIQLRRDVTFHDGRPLRSADVAESLKRLANPEHASYASELMNAIGGIDEFRAEAEEGLPSPDLPGVRIIEPYSFEIFLRGPNPDFLRALAHPATAPVSKSPFDEGAEDALSRPQCAGPYRLEAPYTPGTAEIVLKRFPKYHGRLPTLTGGGSGYAEEVRFRVYPDSNAVFDAFAAGAVDVAGAPPARAAEARARFGPRAVIGDLPNQEFIALPHGTDSPFGDRRVRAALSQALDRTVLVRDVFAGAHQPATGFVPPALTTDPPPRKGKGDVRRVTFDGCGSAAPPTALPDEARRAWAEAIGAADSPAAAKLTSQPIKLYFNDEHTHRKLAETVASQWNAVLGITVEPVPLNWDAYLQKGSIGTGFDGAFRLSHAPQYSSLQSFLGPLFLSGNTTRGNLARYASQPFDDAFEQDVRPETNEQERLLQYRELEELLCNDLPIIPVAYAQSTTVHSERVTPVRASGRLVSRQGDVLLRELAVKQP